MNCQLPSIGGYELTSSTRANLTQKRKKVYKSDQRDTNDSAKNPLERSISGEKE
jgi:hypothetical protein